MSFDDHNEDLRVRGQEPEKKETTNSTSGHFYTLNSVFSRKQSFKDSKIALIISLQKNFKCFFLSGSIKTFTSFEDFFFKVQFPKYVSEIWLEEFF